MDLVKNMFWNHENFPKWLDPRGTLILRGKCDILDHAARSAARKKLRILHDFQRFLAPMETYMAFEKLEFWARMGYYIKSRFWILKGGFPFGSPWYSVSSLTFIMSFHLSRLLKKKHFMSRSERFFRKPSLPSLPVALSRRLESSWKCHQSKGMLFLHRNCKHFFQLQKKSIEKKMWKIFLKI